MGEMLRIEWTDATWVLKNDQGCTLCYSEREWARLSANPATPLYCGRAFGDVRFQPAKPREPWRWRRLRRVFVSSMDDVSHPSVRDEDITAALETFGLADLVPSLKSAEWPLPHVLEGVSVDDQDSADARIPLLVKTPATRRFVSVPPSDRDPVIRRAPMDDGTLWYRVGRVKAGRVLDGRLHADMPAELVSPQARSDR